jgi:hypothetical protein
MATNDDLDFRVRETVEDLVNLRLFGCHGGL